MKLRMLTLLIGLFLPPLASAFPFVPYEADCRTELSIPTDRELQPGIEKGKVRECMRDKAAAARATALKKTRAPRLQRQESILEQVRMKQQNLPKALVNIRALRATPTARRTSSYAEDQAQKELTRRFQAQQCRTSVTKDWMNCIRKAQNP